MPRSRVRRTRTKERPQYSNNDMDTDGTTSQLPRENECSTVPSQSERECETSNEPNNPTDTNHSTTLEEPMEESVLAGEVIFQCGSCRTVVSDTLAGYEGFSETKTILLNAAINVTIEDKLSMSNSGFDTGCTYKRVKCDQCDTYLGKVYTSTTPALDTRRSTYTFDTPALTSYQLGTCRTIDGHRVSLQQGQDAAAPAPHTSQPEVAKSVVTVNAFDALDAHVTSLTDATNRLNSAFEENRDAIADLRRQNTCTISELQNGLQHAQNMMLLWEERFHRLEACEQRIESFCASDQRIESCEGRIARMEAAFRNVPTSPPTGQQPSHRTPARLKVSPVIRRPGPSAARPAQRTATSPVRAIMRGGPSPARGPLRTTSSPAVATGNGLSLRRP